MEPPGFLQHLLGGFKGLFAGFQVKFSVNTSPEPTVEPGIHFKTTVHRTIKIRDSATGELKEYHSLDDVPAEYREKLRQAMAQAPSTPGRHITYTGADGITRTYQSMDEVPPDIRALIERAQQNPDAN